MRKGLWLALLWLSSPLGARELHWRDFKVHALLDGQGLLHITETQTMVFTGDWNGGYRQFRLRGGQRVDLEGIRRLDEASGEAVPLVKGDVSEVDHYEWSDASTLRWRSRLPSDPEFDRTAITYVLEYTLANVLGRSGQAYVLDHDFAFPDRDGAIERFSLDLDLDPAWARPPGFSPHLERANIPPGRGVVVTAELRFAGSGPAPKARRTLTARDLRLALLGYGLLILLLLLRFRQWERSAGRYEALTPASEITPAWLKENLFVWKPEEAGAGWDDEIGAPEVAAVIARLVGEGKIESRLQDKDGASGPKDRILHLVRKVPLTHFAPGYEKDLVEAIFVEGEEIDTEDLRRHYQATGFDPAKFLRQPLKEHTSSGTGASRPAPAWERIPVWALTLAGMTFAGLAFRDPATRGPAAVGLMATVIATVFGMLAAGVVGSSWKKHFGPGLDARLPLLLIPLPFFALPAAIFARVHYGGNPPVSFDPPEGLVLSLLCFALAATMGCFLSIRTADSPALLQRRRKLASSRGFFQEELSKPSPALVDAWYPYLVAFGLDKNVEAWFRSYGGTSTGSATFTGGGSGSGVSSTSWSGGGGAFGGAGASAGWAAAAAGIAGGVAAPSSSGGGSGGGGGGSSGGGGGGGW
jgi:uncharacterized membrane protein YgcG